jgi:hypothetical protein
MAGRRIHMNAPVVPVDLLGGDEHGQPVTQWSCDDCLPWHFEVIREPDSEYIYIREWHAIDCATLAYIVAAINGVKAEEPTP